MPMNIEFDPVKNAINIEQHGLKLSDFEKLNFEDGVFTEDNRHAYGESRIRLIAPLAGRICVAVFTMRSGAFRVISLRKANLRERKAYEENKQKR